VAFSLDGIAGHQFGTTTLNPATCSASLTFPVAGGAGAHQIFGYVPNSGAPVASAPFTILAAPAPAPATPDTDTGADADTHPDTDTHSDADRHAGCSRTEFERNQHPAGTGPDRDHRAADHRRGRPVPPPEAQSLQGRA
jgi:hypothetical protein